jgi:Undecaprenyl-phosphate galactose phosphotransferase WbaP
MLIAPVWCVGAVVTGQAPGWGLGAIEELRRVQLLLITVFALAGIAYVLGQDRILPSRIVYLSSYLFAAFLLPFGRMAVRKVLGRCGCWGCGVALYGDRSTIERMTQVFASESNIGYHPAAIFSDDFKKGEAFEGIPVAGGLQDTMAGVPVAVASIAHLREKNLVGFVDHTLADYRKVVLLPGIDGGVFSWVVPRDFNGMVGLELSRNLLNPLAAGTKLIYEIALVLLFLPLWLPLILLLALLVFLGDRRNPFYRQTRIGKKGRLFKAIKLRTMVPNADEALQLLIEKDAELKAEWETFYKLKNDPRITPVGRFLRRFSLDELPQLFNVLAGEMALVGPRPLPVYHHEELSENSRRFRSRVRPGMTGQWQVSGRSDCGLAEMEQWDSFYVRNWSIWMDIYILARTFKVVLFSHGAY